jgi:hypothetical protein
LFPIEISRYEFSHEYQFAEKLVMKAVFISMILLLALSIPASAGNNQGQQGQNGGSGAHGAPGPLVGAGLPVLLIGGGIYWIVRRKKAS